MVSLILSLFFLPIAITLLLILHLNVILVVSASPSSSSSSSSSSIQCRSGWSTKTQITISPSQINDGYCDCPYDGYDEPNTDACSGSMDGGWAGISPKYISSDLDAAKLPTYFSCPQQPTLHLPLSRVNDGICDCCDGADESTTKCPDICDQVLAKERAAKAKSIADYEIGSKKRNESINQYKEWYVDSQTKLSQLKDVELVQIEKDQMDVDQKLKDAKEVFATQWLEEVKNTINESTLKSIVSPEHYHVPDLASFIISLCWLSAESSPDNIANDRCVAFDRASLDLGLLWDYSDDDKDILPNYNTLGNGADDLIDYAEKIMLRLEGKDIVKEKTSNKRTHKKKIKKQPEPEPDSSDDPYGDDWEDHHDYHYDDDYVEPEEDEYHDDHEGNNESEKDTEEASSDTQILVKTLLGKVPVDRTLFKEQSKALLKISQEKESKDETDDKREEVSTTEEDETKEDDKNEDSGSSGVDPMAIQMVKSSLSKRLSSISRGETAAKSVTRFVASVIDREDNHIALQKLAVMTMYHSKLSFEDIAELIYSTSTSLRLKEEKESDPSCSVSWDSMCSPRSTHSGYPPSFIVEAAQKRCEQYETSSTGICPVVEEGDEVKFPTTIDDGYYNYYAPQPRGSDDGLSSYFSGIDALHNEPRGNIVSLRKQKDSIDRNRSSLKKKVSDLEHDIGDDTKYGVDGELYNLRDTCHKVESGKYEYEVCIHKKATQRDIGQKSGGTNLGSWEGVEVEDGQRTLKWGGGTKCWNGPVRSAEVVVTCGADDKVLTADEPETCRYVFTMESPVGCDEQFKKSL